MIKVFAQSHLSQCKINFILKNFRSQIFTLLALSQFQLIN